MTGLDVVAIIILLLLLLLGIAVFVFLGSWPGRVAARRGHEYAEAITVGGWVTLVLGAVFWPLVLTWAYAGGSEPESPTDSDNIIETWS
jgi:hypothetical protein